jgi:DNA-binding NarL/FixJ family response regulator
MLTRPRVLLADDHPSVAKALVRMLSLDCDVVGVVGDGNDVASAAVRLQPVVLVLDVHLPNVSGIDICREINRNDLRAKVIVITGMVDDSIRDEAFAAGASGFLHKLSTDELMAAINRAWRELTPDNAS